MKTQNKENSLRFIVNNDSWDYHGYNDIFLRVVIINNIQTFKIECSLIHLHAHVR